MISSHQELPDAWSTLSNREIFLVLGTQISTLCHKGVYCQQEWQIKSSCVVSISRSTLSLLINTQPDSTLLQNHKHHTLCSIPCIHLWSSATHVMYNWWYSRHAARTLCALAHHVVCHLYQVILATLAACPLKMPFMQPAPDSAAAVLIASSTMFMLLASYATSIAFCTPFQ